MLLVQGDLVGLAGWVRRAPTTKLRKNGDAVLLLDLEDEHGACLRVICLGAIRDRCSPVCLSHTHRLCAHLHIRMQPTVLTYRNVHTHTACPYDTMYTIYTMPIYTHMHRHYTHIYVQTAHADTDTTHARLCTVAPLRIGAAVSLTVISCQTTEGGLPGLAEQAALSFVAVVKQLNKQNNTMICYGWCCADGATLCCELDLV